VPSSIVEAGEDYYWARFKVKQLKA